MPHIVADSFKTKKKFKQHVETLEGTWRAIDPSIYQPKDYYVRFIDVDGSVITNMLPGESFTCTNHPKRSWFAKVTYVGGNKFKVE